ncbi:MAG: phosphatidylglycerophosphatase A [Phycisphaerales bacterium]|nr:phosphatidylglycerophosphatase A [Phycisphaerales bacterium]
MPSRPTHSIALALATTLGLGHLRPAPGTWGSLPPVALGLLLLALGLAATPVHTVAMLALLLVFCGSCIAGADEAEARFGRKDPSQVVADETAGMALVLLLLPPPFYATPAQGVVTLALAFFAFRAMDILKPWPANPLQRIPGGWGVLLDDLAAALYAAAIVHLAFALAA